MMPPDTPNLNPIPSCRGRLNAVAREYLAAGLCVLPASATEKRPTMDWREFQVTLPTWEQIDRWEWPRLCVVAGAVSGNLEFLDFDAGGLKFSEWSALIPDDLMERLLVERTPSGGYHATYRCDGPVDGNQKLATSAEGECWIETRGEGGLCLVAPSTGYELVQGNFLHLPVLTADQRERLLAAARSLNERWEPASLPPAGRNGSSAGDRPGDHYNATADFLGLLRRHGWETIKEQGGQLYLRRPGKSGREWSATLRDGMLYVFSSNANPFQAGRCYDAFGALAVLEHGGDFRAAAASLEPQCDLAGIVAATNKPTAERRRVEPIVTCLADVESRPIDWLWRGRIPLGRLTLLVGRPGEGKSFVTLDAAARISTGSPWPDRSPCPLGSVLLVSAEDDPADTIRPRLDAMGADPRRIRQLSGVRFSDRDGQVERVITLHDIDTIKSTLAEMPDCRLIVVDPIGSYLGEKTDAHRDNEVRAVLAPIAKLAEQYGLAVLIVAHRRKSAGSVADDLALGSRAFTGIARAVWHLSRDPENKARRLLLPGKNNLSREGNGLAFTILGDPPRVAWERDPVEMSADDALAAEYKATDRTKPGPAAEAKNDAVEWLRNALADGPRPAKVLKDEWTNGCDGSLATLKRAKQFLKIESYRDIVPGPWIWRLPSQGDQSPGDEYLEHLEPLADSSEFSTDSNPQQSKGIKLSDLEPLGADDGRERERFTI